MKPKYGDETVGDKFNEPKQLKRERLRKNKRKYIKKGFLGRDENGQLVKKPAVGYRVNIYVPSREMYLEAGRLAKKYDYDTLSQMISVMLQQLIDRDLKTKEE